MNRASILSMDNEDVAPSVPPKGRKTSAKGNRKPKRSTISAGSEGDKGVNQATDQETIEKARPGASSVDVNTVSPVNEEDDLKRKVNEMGKKRAAANKKMAEYARKRDAAARDVEEFDREYKELAATLKRFKMARQVEAAEAELARLKAEMNAIEQE